MNRLALAVALVAAACATPDGATRDEPPAAASPQPSATAPATPPSPQRPNELGPGRTPAPTPPPPSPVPFASVTVTTRGAPTVAFRIHFRTGSVDDPPAREGITALAAAIMSEGGTKSLSSAELIQKLFPMATDVGAQVDKEVTVFAAAVHPDHVDRFLPILTEVLTAPRWDPKEFERLRTDALNDIEKRLRTSDDENLGKEALEWLLYRGHPYGHYVGGTAQALKAVTLDEVKAQAARVFTRERLTIGVAADEPQIFVGRLEAALAALPERGAPARDVAAPAAPSGPKVLIVEKEAQSTAVSLGHPWALRRGHPDFYPMMAAISAFGEHRQFTGRLMRKLRVERGLNYGDYAYVEAFHQEGWSTLPLTNVSRTHQRFSVWIRPVVHENRFFALRAALYHAQKFRDAGLPPQELALTQGFLAGYTLVWEQTPMRRLGYALDEKFYGNPGHLAGFRAALPKLDRTAVNAAIARYVDPGVLRVAVITKDGAALKSQLLAGGPAAVKYATPPPREITEEDTQINAFPLGLVDADIQVMAASEMFEK